MFNIKNLTAGLFFIFLLAFPAVPAFAATSTANIGRPQPEIMGTISDINGGDIVIFANNTNYTVDAGRAKITSSGKNLNISDLKAGDSLVILGPINGKNITASFIFVNATGTTVKGDTFIGTIKQLGENSFTLQPNNADNTIQTVNILSDTIFMRGSATAYTANDLGIGQKVVVTGEKDQNDVNIINANKVEIVISNTPLKQTVTKEAPAAPTEGSSFFGRIFKAVGGFFTKIFSWL